MNLNDTLTSSARAIRTRKEPGWWFLALLMAALTGPAVRAGDWPEFRGPWGTGHASAPGAPAMGLPLTWSETENVVWKIAIPPMGLSTPVVMNGQVWLTTATEDGHDFYVICADAGTGKILLNQKIFHSDNPESLGNGAGFNTYATPSAVIELGRVYVHYGSFGTACLDTKTFEVLWKREDLPCRHYRGASSSPVLFEDLLILTFDGADLQYHAALNKRTGATVWKTNRSVEWTNENLTNPMVRDGDWRKAHSTPLIVTSGGKPQMLSVGARAVYGYDPRTGKELWRAEFFDWSAAPRPVFHNGRAIIVTGFNRPTMMAVKTDGQGNVTGTHVDWTSRTRVPKYASPIVVDDLLYIAADESFVSCIDPATGEAIWSERVGGAFRASPIYADGRLYFFSQDGTTTVLKPGRAFEVLATNKLGTAAQPGENRRPIGFAASPAVADNSFFLRTRDHLYRIQEGNPKPE